MAKKKIIDFAIKCVMREVRHYRQFFDMYKLGFETEKPGHDKYLLAKETLQFLEELRNGI